MKLLPISLLASLLSISVGSYANIDVTFDRDIQLLAVNGESEGFTFGHRSELTLEPGEHQLLVRAERVIPMSGKKNKYKSPLMVVKISGHEGKLNLAPTMIIRNEGNALEFDRHPALDIELRQGALEIEQDFIPGRSFGLMGDYRKELTQFNRTESKAAIHRSALTRPVAASRVEKGATGASLEIDKLEMIQQVYLELDEAQRKAFLSWAISQ
ncbi:DUF2057 domain-containing protein [Vibrio cincinnatiensis]|uniref:DUF2057 domain-containing protein n=1 Tax=Vibrio cincinnatiensis TaxID=675 RepID=UPI001EE054F7|nr:DUF2057 domain-containing protein [Vibrio cincinnatiensis]MCG3727966.1 DUF2057 domain-containing protein [Vibrio cincinnatiensis]